jgi:Ca-activated chloride channel family protein
MKRCVFGPRETPTAAIALRGVRLRCRLSGMSQRTTVEQTYVNLEREAIEAVYTFPLPESAAVCAFEVFTGDRVLTGEVEEVEKATEHYDDAIADGHGAFLAEQHRPDVFSVRVGNLLPRQAVTVRLTYVCPLERVDRAVRVAFPTTVAPRYVTATATDPLDAQVDGDALNPPHVLNVPYGLTMEVDVDLGRPLRRIVSPSHHINVANRDETRATVSLAGGLTEMDRDVVLSIELEKEHQPVVQVATGKHGESYLAVTFVPEFDVDELLDPEPSETIFVLDCSGSMQGDSISQATAALELCLRSLSPGDTFNVCRFGSTFDLLASEPLHYSEETLKRAVDYVGFAPDLGGTELYAALHAVMTPSPRVGRRRQVVVLTDGQVSNEPALLELARDLRLRNRVFSFGIGSAASAGLVKGLARATGGAAEFIAGNERIDDKVLRTFGRLTSPFVEDVSIDWDGCDVQTLAELPPVFDGDVMTVFGRAPGKAPRVVTLSCRAPSGPKRWSVPVPPAADDAGVIATMWARRTIQSLEDVNHLNQNRYRGGKKKSREEQTVVQLSKEFNLLSSLTAFVAVEHRSAELRNEGAPALRRIPVALASGWGGLATGKRCRGACGAYAMMAAGPANPAVDTIDKLADAMAEAPIEYHSAKRQRGALYHKAESLRESVPTPPSAAPAGGSAHTLDSTMKSLDRKTASNGSVGALSDAQGDASDDDATQAPLIALLDAVLTEAMRSGASDIHFESHQDHMTVRYRIDDQLVERDRIPHRFDRFVVRRLKAMAGIDRGQSVQPQKGRIRWSFDGGPVDFDVSVLPAEHGPSVVLHVQGYETVRHAASLRAILGLQQADGWFGWDRVHGGDDPADAALRRFGHDPAARFRATRRLVPPTSGPTWDPDRIARTVLVLALFHDHYQAENPLWRRAAQKAIRYVQHALGREAPEIKALIQAVRASATTDTPA